MSDRKIISLFLLVIAAILVSRLIDTPVRLKELQFCDPKVIEKGLVPQ